MDTKLLIEKLRAIASDSKDAEELRGAILELADDLEVTVIDQDQWDAVMANAEFMLIEYKKIPNGMFGAINIANAINRYNEGERTRELYKELESIQ